MKYLLVLLFLTGCSTTSDYQKYLEMQTSVQTAKANADAAKYTAVSTIAGTDTTAKVVAMFLLHGATQSQPAYIAPPKSTSDSIKEWVGILVPSILQGYGVYSNTQLGMRQSDNATELGVSTNSTFLGMAGYVQAPAANMNIGGDGVVGSGSFSATNGSYNPSSTDNSNQDNPTDNSVVSTSPTLP